jgi:NADH-quinone oxidoreductase subunit J
MSQQIQLSIFYFLAFVSIFSAIVVVTVKNPVYSVLWLVVTFFSIAGQYLLLNAQFLAVVNIIVYAGAIMVLFLFVIMLMNMNALEHQQKSAGMQLAAVVAGGLLMLTLVSALRDSGTSVPATPFNTATGLVKGLGQNLYSKYLLPFEISTLLFFVAMIGALVLGKRDIKQA